AAPLLTDATITALQQQAKLEGWTFTVGKNPATNQSLSQLCGMVVPDHWWVNASFDPCLPTTYLPTRFDWRVLGGCTPIKDQDGCGSCWAFGTVAPLECNILIRDHKVVDLSEQWLVSCNRDHWGCNGGWYAHDYHQWKTDKYNGTGAVLEQDFPYTATDAPCNGPYQHPYRIDSWHYIGFSQSIPPVDSIKQAIMAYGPVSVSCAVTSAFAAYTGGVFNTNDPHATINHCVALVGWDDTQGAHGVWFLRNSWGAGWGEQGYMRIEYGVCKVGYGACYVEYPPRTLLEISGGFLGLSIGFRNVGNRTTTNIAWNITMRGGILGTVNQTVGSTISSLDPGTVLYERLPQFGFGPVSIAVAATPKNAGRLTMHTDGYLFGVLLLINHSH
ncbi:MAG TPA: C1 family peptidase, partial [Candidatus Thermoplasmatota archaeon]|nr:C1 family peptidase [Candidatus Thermoplasmatota archaeon]